MLGHTGSRLSSGGSGSVLPDALEISSLNILGVDLDQVPVLDLSLVAELCWKNGFVGGRESL